MKCEKRRAARYANMASILHETYVRAVKRCSGGWRLPARRMEACRRHAFFSALAENAAMGLDCVDLGTCCQETPRWGLFSGGYSSALFSENYVTWPFVELSYSVRAFAGFSLRNEVCREAPLSRFLPSGARDAAQFSCDAFRRKVSSSRDWSCFEYHVFYGCEQQKWKHQIGG